MAGLAAGMASEGYHVFIYSIANFPTFRCAEQIRNDIDYQKLPVTIVAVGGGLSYGPLGYSHHAVQDFALMRLMPNLVIASPGDPSETRACLRYLVDNPTPSYLRLGKTGEPCLHADVPKVSLGGWLRIRGGGDSDRAVLTTGTVLADVVRWSESLDEKLDIYSCPIWGMSAKPLQAPMLESISGLLSVEDHLVDGGFGSWLSEICRQRADYGPRLECLALDPVVCGLVGTQHSLNMAGGLTESAFRQKVSRLVS